MIWIITYKTLPGNIDDNSVTTNNEDELFRFYNNLYHRFFDVKIFEAQEIKIETTQKIIK